MTDYIEREAVLKQLHKLSDAILNMPTEDMASRDKKRGEDGGMERHSEDYNRGYARAIQDMAMIFNCVQIRQFLQNYPLPEKISPYGYGHGYAGWR